jgi:long-chain acyl-CoA synthetase
LKLLEALDDGGGGHGPASAHGDQRGEGLAGGPGLTGELLAFLGGRLARYKLPRTIDYVAELPRDPNGKLYQRRLRDTYWTGRDRVI